MANNNYINFEEGINDSDSTDCDVAAENYENPDQTDYKQRLETLDAVAMVIDEAMYGQDHELRKAVQNITKQKYSQEDLSVIRTAIDNSAKYELMKVDEEGCLYFDDDKYADDGENLDDDQYLEELYYLGDDQYCDEERNEKHKSEEF